MKISKIISTYALGAMLQIILLIGLLMGSLIGNRGSAYSGPLPTKYFSIEEKCGPGDGLALGESQVVQGKVIIIRTTRSYGCWAKKGLSLFDKDTISTQENGRMRFSFNDGSLVTLSYMTELEITRSIYDQAAKERSLFLNMRSGKARFVVRKLDNFKYSEVKIKTQTALVIVVGSDFIIEADSTSTRITALEGTRLEVISLANSEARPTVLSDFKWTIVKENIIPSEVDTISQEEVEKMLKDFTFVDSEEKKDAPESHEPVVHVIQQDDNFDENRDELDTLDELDKLEEKSLVPPMNEIFDDKYDDEIKEILPRFPDPPGGI